MTLPLDRYGRLLASLDEALTDGLEGTYRPAGADLPRTVPTANVVTLPPARAIPGL